MHRYEYKIVDVKAGGWSLASARAREALVDLLNREGRSGWRLVPTPQQTHIGWRSVLLQRELE